jgi:filamentous hemagglutinin|nr:filamentous hemagglutinin N-terminal domain-containing protein [Pseudomonas moraviensis]
MDIRHLALLASQPSAAVKKREQFCGMPKRGLAFLLANVMFWQPVWAQADGIVVSAPGTSLDRAGNGVPIVNIAAPNGSGLSHNQFHDYNVGAQGVILNNATDRMQQTQLGGIILGNPNLRGAAAQTILNEVNGGSPSQLRGYTEVAGQSARVIVSNPYGISCNGCGFINTPRVTLPPVNRCSTTVAWSAFRSIREAFRLTASVLMRATSTVSKSLPAVRRSMHRSTQKT